MVIYSLWYFIFATYLFYFVLNIICNVNKQFYFYFWINNIEEIIRCVYKQVIGNRIVRAFIMTSPSIVGFGRRNKRREKEYYLFKKYLSQYYYFIYLSEVNIQTSFFTININFHSIINIVLENDTKSKCIVTNQTILLFLFWNIIFSIVH